MWILRKVINAVIGALALGLVGTAIVVFILSRHQFRLTPLTLLETFVLSGIVGVVGSFHPTPRSQWGNMLVGIAILAVFTGEIAIGIVLALHK